MDVRQVPAWRQVPVEELRRFMAELVQDSNLREAGRLIGRGREAVRKFVSGDIDTPHPRTREAIARLYVQRYGKSARKVAEVAQSGSSPTPLKLILPRGVERATTEIRAIFDIVRSSEAVPASTVSLERWLLRRVRDEYAAEVPYARPRQRRRPKKDEDEPDT